MSDDSISLDATAVMDSGEALDIYVKSTGELPPPIPNGCNSITKTFTTKDGMPAIICKQRGFKPDGDESDDDVNGYMVIFVKGAESEEVGFAALNRFIEGLKES